MEVTKENLEVLKCTRKLLDKKENWTQGEMARTDNGIATAINSSKAARYCLFGGLSRCRPDRCRPDLEDGIEIEILRKMIPSLVKSEQSLPEAQSLLSVNDDFSRSKSHRLIKKLLDISIEYCQSQLQKQPQRQ